MGRLGLSVALALTFLAPICNGEAVDPAKSVQDDGWLFDDGMALASNSMLVFAQEVNSSVWMLIGLNVNSAKAHPVLRVPSRADSPAQCGFALTSGTTAVFYNGEQLETWDLSSGKRTGTQKTDQSQMETIDYNSASGEIEGVCQLWLPEQNMSATCWCAVQGDNMTNVHQMPTDYFGETRSACVSYIEPETSTFWFPSDTYDNKNRFLVEMPIGGGSTSYDWKWFGAINGSVLNDAYVHDYALNRSFAIQLGEENTTSQLVEVMHGIEPYSKDNPMPRLLHTFPDNFGLVTAGMAVYDQAQHQIYAIMHRLTGATTATSNHAIAKAADHRTEAENVMEDDGESPISSEAQYLVNIDVVSMKITFQEIVWPRSPLGFSLQSVRSWHSTFDEI